MIYLSACGGLRTPSRDDALPFGYKPENVCLEGTSTLPIEYTLRRTSVGTVYHCS